jgi:hypothetical protein
MASAPARPGAEGIVVVNLQAHLRSQLRFIRGNLARLDRSASKGWLTADESRELSFCERMLGAVRPFKNADTDLQNAKLFWEVHDLLVAVGKNERRRRARGAGPQTEAPAASGAEEDEEMDRVLNARFQSMGPSHADLGM